MAKATHGYGRTRRFTVRFTEDEAKQLVEVARSTGAKTPSAQLRKFALAPRQTQMPPWEHLRALINAMVQCAEEVRKTGSSKAIEAKAIEAFDRIVRF